MSLVTSFTAPVAKNPSGALSLLAVDAQATALVTTGGVSSALALAAGQNLVKASAGLICRIVITTVGTAGTLAVNDAATIGAVAPGNLIYSGSNTTAAGTIIDLQFPCANGIVVTVPTGGTASVSYI